MRTIKGGALYVSWSKDDLVLTARNTEGEMTAELKLAREDVPALIDLLRQAVREP